MAAIDVEYTRKVRELPRRRLPVLDLGPLRAGDAAGIARLVRELRDVASGIGFLCVVDHGVPAAVIDRARDRFAAMFALPDAAKIAVPVDQHERGYLPFRSTKVRHSRYHGGVQSDWYECFNYGPDYPDDHPGVQQGLRLYGSNRWPEGVPGLVEAALAFRDDVAALGMLMLPLWARALDLPEDWFAPYFARVHPYVRPIHYPPKAGLAVDEMGIGAHSDTSFATFLAPENEPGLQVMEADGTWVWPDCPPDGLIVNFGQFLERWSNSVVRATPHRVIPSTRADRISLPLFFCPELDCVCECLPSCCGPDNPPRFPAQSFRQFHLDYMSRVYAHFEAFGGDGERK